MPSLEGRRVIYRRGSRMVIAVIRNGECEVDDFLSALPPRAKSQFQTRFERYCEVGFLRNPDQMRRIDVDERKPHVYEIKVPDGPGYRLFGIVEASGLFVATHGAPKPKQSALKSHVTKSRDHYGK